MEKTLHLRKSTTQLVLLFATAIVALLGLTVLGAQSASAAISTQLDFGDRGSEVTELQTFLATNPNIYPSALVTGYFGPLTQAGVQKFQVAEGIVSAGTPQTTGYGRVGPRTQAALNAKFAFGGDQSGDMRSPTIERVDVNTDNNGASITWTASEASTGKVYYSTSPITFNAVAASNVPRSGPTVSGTLANHDTVARTTHTVDINNLEANTRYFYLLVIFDEAENISLTIPNSFRTAQ